MSGGACVGCAETIHTHTHTRAFACTPFLPGKLLNIELAGTTYINGVHKEFLAGKSQNARSCTVHVYWIFGREVTIHTQPYTVYTNGPGTNLHMRTQACVSIEGCVCLCVHVFVCACVCVCVCACLCVQYDCSATCQHYHARHTHTHTHRHTHRHRHTHTGTFINA
jgi:hypothetical protein